jgi:hypothetical protein
LFNPRSLGPADKGHGTFQDAKYVAQVIKDINEVYKPHPGQKLIGQAIFGEGARYVGVECGRNFGKTDVLGSILYRWGMLIPEEQFYYCAPFYNQASELVWESGRLPNFLKHLEKRYVAHIYDSDRRVLLKNGSFIKLLGSDNHQTSRGLKPKGVGYDEYKDFDYRFDKGMRDNLAAKKAPIVIVGTAPKEQDHFFYTTMDDFKVRKGGRYFNFPSSVNPHIDPDEIEEARLSAIRRGDYAEFQREWLAMRVFGGADAIFPMLELPPLEPFEKKYVGTSRHVIKYDDIIREIRKRPKDWEFFTAYDAGTVTCFAVLLMAVNKFDRRVICLDEIYEQDQAKTTTDQIYPQALEKMEEIEWREDSWLESYDNAAAWFGTEVMHLYNRNILPCEKDVQKKEEKLALIKDMLINGLLQITDKCQNLLKEMANYYRDDKGKIPKKNDHLIDCLRYNLNAAHYTRIEKIRKPVDQEQRKVFKLSRSSIYEPSDDSPDHISVAEEFEKIIRRNSYDD